MRTVRAKLFVATFVVGALSALAVGLVHQQAARIHYGSGAVEELGLEIHDVPQRLRRYPPSVLLVSC